MREGRSEGEERNMDTIKKKKIQKEENRLEQRVRKGGRKYHPLNSAVNPNLL